MIQNGQQKPVSSDGAFKVEKKKCSFLIATVLIAFFFLFFSPVFLLGIFPPYSDGTDVNAVDRSHDGDELVTSDDFGKVNLFRYPALEVQKKVLSIARGCIV